MNLTISLCGCGDEATSTNGHVPECEVCKDSREQAEAKGSHIESRHSLAPRESTWEEDRQEVIEDQKRAECEFYPRACYDERFDPSIDRS